MKCEGCGTVMEPAAAAEDADDQVVKWKCPRCGSWCFADGDDIVVGAWLVEGREWPR